MARISASTPRVGSYRGRCDTCGRPLISASARCLECRERPILTCIDRVIPLFPYGPAAQALLTSWKAEGRTALTGLLADCLAHAIDAPESVTVVPVPPRPGKVRERGWDQIEAIAASLERRHRLTVSRCLERKTAFQQKKLGRLARAENMRGGISVIAGKNVPGTALVIDDLMTTGSTLNACAEALKGAGCQKVVGLTLFYD
jgi:ComF family protein